MRGVKDDFKDGIRVLMALRNVSRNQLSKQSDVSLYYISRALQQSRTSGPGLDEMRQMAEAFNLSMDEVIDIGQKARELVKI